MANIKKGLRIVSDNYWTHHFMCDIPDYTFLLLLTDISVGRDKENQMISIIEKSIGQRPCVTSQRSAH